MSSSSVSTSAAAPTVTTDPRYRAARRLIATGRAAEGAIEMLATLVEEAVSKYGDDSVDAAACYYEYGHALFRAAERRRAEEEEIMGTEEEDEVGNRKPAAAMAAAEAAEKRAAATATSTAPGATTKAEAADKHEVKDSNATGAASEQNGGGGNAEDASNDDELNDSELSLELMENAFAIFDAYCAGDTSNDDGGGGGMNDTAKAEGKEGSSTATSKPKPHLAWVADQLPRTLSGIGDVLLSLRRHADGVDAYTRTVSLREEAVESYEQQKGGDGTNCADIDFLKARRLLCEANILVAEALLACPRGRDVITTETGDVLVPAGEIVEYAQGYYDKARDELQDTVYLMGKIAAGTESEEFQLEKENVCYCAQMLAGVGNVLAEREGEEQGRPVAKKQKTG